MREEFAIVPVDDAGALRRARGALDRGLGCAWVGDNRQGFHGGASLLRWVRDEAEARSAIEFFRERCDRVRVMPFLEGVPCSIHGLVFGDRTIAFRPCEMLVFRRSGRSDFHYGRAGTFWDPPAADREDMRAIARRVGDHLRKSVDYRGAFTIDGIMTEHGFRPTELNPRYGGALNVVVGGLQGLSLELINLAVIERVDAEWLPEELEDFLVRGADESRGGNVTSKLDVPVTTPRKARLMHQPDGTFREGNAEEPADATLVLDASWAGSFLSITFDPERTPKGPSLAPRAAAALAWADAELGLGLGRLEPAREVRN